MFSPAHDSAGNPVLGGSRCRHTATSARWSGLEPLLRLLRLIPGSEVIDLDAGCCGMAGSFGYEAEHYEVSRLVGERRLLPSVRKAEPADIIVAPGFSCRLQIQHFTDRAAVHPAMLLRSCLN